MGRILSSTNGGQSSVIKSIQSGLISGASGPTSSQSVTISAVNTAKCVLVAGCAGQTGYAGGVTASLTNSTTLSLYGSTQSTSMSISWQVVEYY